MSSSECSIPIRRIINYTSGEDDLRIIRVQNMRFKVNPCVLRAGSAVFKSILKSRDSPIVLSGHTSAQFRSFLWAVYVQPLPSAKSIDIGRLCSIAEVSFKYEFHTLKLWSMEGIKALVDAPNSILRTARSEIFVRLVRLALLYRAADLNRAVQSKWLTRIHWHDLDPAPALVVADAYDLRHLLCHAYYVHLVNVAPRIAHSQSISAEYPLSIAQNLHVFCGYHSLLAAWRQLQEFPPAFAPAADCSAHDRCLIAWTARWALEVGRPSVFSPVDILRRLLFMERHLETDAVLQECMGAECRLAALDAIAKKRAEISDNLHHHFDL
ncbi:hypothetical protein DFH07DRAFT_965423 [Mycena maculata]|uniref:BTB domain-containing protein n=1 Tax=Mycena maculata TaxID=230809 RepID=A0AAD7IEM9_9AGAR|nr:hypothetical protein DFH07DRAFT_965423 [Mycena maculata]